jgi:co-chaperonin GroES (HSP10)
MQAYGKFVLIRPAVGKDTTDSGLYIPNGAGDFKNRGTIVSVGLGCTQDGNNTNSFRLKVDDKVIYGSSIKFPHNGEDFLVVKEEDVFVVL